MKEIAGTKIPSFTENQSIQLKGSIDFIALNYYSSVFVSNDPLPKEGPQDFINDMSALLSGLSYSLIFIYNNILV